MLAIGEFRNRSIRTRILALALTAISAAFLFGCGGGDGPDPVTPEGPTTSEEYTQSGWKSFESGDFAAAREDFETARTLDPENSEAIGGVAWCKLSTAATPAAMQETETYFTAAIEAGWTEAAAYAGRAASRMGAGADHLVGAGEDAHAAFALDADFAFEHRASFDYRDLLLIDATVRAAQGDFVGAVTTLDAAGSSGIDFFDPESWHVDTLDYDTFAGAVLAYLQVFSEVHSG